MGFGRGDPLCAAPVRCAAGTAGSRCGAVCAPMEGWAQWKSRGAETLLAVHADTPTGLKKAAQSLRSSFGADVYGAGDTSLAAARRAGAGSP